MLPDPLTGEGFIKVPDTGPSEIDPFVDSLKKVPKHGLHNPLKNPERWGLEEGKLGHRLADLAVSPVLTPCLLFARLWAKSHLICRMHMPKQPPL